MPIESKKVRILKIEEITHDTKSFILERPEGYNFKSGQSAFLAIDSDEWRKENRQFSISSTPNSNNLEFIIKIYSDRPGVTNAMSKLQEGEYLLISRPFGMINHDESKGGIFIAAGSGVTKFISLFRDLHERKKLSNIIFIYSNKAKKDVILEKELKEMFSASPSSLILALSREKKRGYTHGRINEKLIRNALNGIPGRKVHAAGSEEFIRDIMKIARKIQNESNSSKGK